MNDTARRTSAFLARSLVQHRELVVLFEIWNIAAKVYRKYARVRIPASLTR